MLLGASHQLQASLQLLRDSFKARMQCNKCSTNFMASR
jgi:hypothetical protein